MARSNNSEALGLLEGEDDLEKTRVINIKTSRNSLKFFPVALYFIFGVLGFVLGRILPASDVYVGEAESVSPGRQEVRYRSKVFDQGYGENTTDGKRVYYAGPPSQEIDAAWNALEDAKYLRITEDEMRQLREPTAALHAGGGYLLSFDTYHQLHCLNYIRMALEPEYYSFEQSPEALKHHIVSQASQTPSESYLAQSPSGTIGTQDLEKQAESPCVYGETELILLMYYFDHIFPRLCPFFAYTAANNGRGWLLSLFLRTRPLCAAAICLSTCDKAQFVLGPLSDVPQPNHDLEMQHIRIVIELRDHLSQLTRKTGASRMAAAVEALACIMHLILFELWIPRKGLMNDWVMHLDAATALLSSVDLVTPVPLSDLPSNLIPPVGPSENGVVSNFSTELLSEGEKSAFEFFLTQYTYCFIISAASLGLPLQCMQSIQRTRTIYHRGQSKLKDMIGCEDLVLVTLLDVAVLKDWKKQMQARGALSLRELARRASAIEERLNEALATLTSPRTYPKSRNEEQQGMITRAFVSGTLVFLHVVVSGFYTSLPEIRQAVMQTLTDLERIQFENLNPKERRLAIGLQL
ncbi:hypothetical protein GQ53DRAFT_817680 [Thozetella sp. PMI_491]|nr:hypothetical protein GQ53DRAFT_817680 [Thozetella sp. PMI_491]